MFRPLPFFVGTSFREITRRGATAVPGSLIAASMSSRFAVILNPAARHGWAGRQRQRLDEALAASGLGYDVHVTQYAGHAIELARQLAHEHAVVVAAGGDGTVNEVSQGLIHAGNGTHLGLVPIGTGNDFTKMIGVPPQVERAVEVLARIRPRRVDYGRFRWWEESEQPVGEGSFVNAIGMGFDAQVAASVDRFRFLPGKSSYVAAVFDALRRWSTPMGSVRVGHETVYEGRLFLVTTSNGQCSGGGFYLTPSASVEDGRLDLIVFEGVGVGRILQLLPQVMRGRHTTAPDVHMRRARRVEVATDAPVPIHVDGEVVTRLARRLEVEVVPGGLSVLHP